jgi:hypothetical protein
VNRNTKSAPASTEGAASGSVIRRNARTGPTDVRAASSSPAPISRNAFLENRTTNGKCASANSIVAPESPPIRLSVAAAPRPCTARTNWVQPMAIKSGGSTSGNT